MVPMSEGSSVSRFLSMERVRRLRSLHRGASSSTGHSSSFSSNRSSCSIPRCSQMAFERASTPLAPASSTGEPTPLRVRSSSLIGAAPRPLTRAVAPCAPRALFLRSRSVSDVLSLAIMPMACPESRTRRDEHLHARQVVISGQSLPVPRGARGPSRPSGA